VDKQFTDRISELQKAVQDTEWFEKLKKVNTVEEFAVLCEEKGIRFSEDELKKGVALLSNDTSAPLSDEELAEATGGFSIGISIDLCQKEYSHFCHRMFWGKCEHFKIEYENQMRYVSCDKGFFKKIYLLAI
jgi:predicted ribosomally synthesized peptide with nif11-like leader